MSPEGIDRLGRAPASHQLRRGVPAEWLGAAERGEAVARAPRRAAAILAIHVAAYLATLVGAVAPLPLPLNLFFGAANGLAIGLLFIIGHDAVHGSFARSAAGNDWVARLVFLPALHARSLWELVHNRIHHRFTNLAGPGFDYVWAPMSKAAYDAASPARRRLERFYRSGAGPLLYYWCEFWLPRLFIPVSAEARPEWRRHLPDSVFVVVFGAALIASIGALGGALAPARPPALTLLLGWFVPYAVWNYMMALTIFLHHNHPAVPWFDDRREWSFYEGQLRGCVQVELPFAFLPLFTWIMIHNAHHALPAIPMYNLAAAQQALLGAYGDDIVRYRFTLGEYRRIRRACKLFDFRRRQWTDFDGRPTAPPIRLPRAAAASEA